MPTNQRDNEQVANQLFEELKALHVEQMKKSDDSARLPGASELSELFSVSQHGVVGETGDALIADKIQGIIDKKQQDKFKPQYDGIVALLAGISIKAEAKETQTPTDQKSIERYKKNSFHAINQYMASLDNTETASLPGLLNYYIEKAKILHRELDEVLKAQLELRSDVSEKAVDSARTSDPDFVSPRSARSLSVPTTIPQPVWTQGKTPRAGSAGDSSRSSEAIKSLKYIAENYTKLDQTKRGLEQEVAELKKQLTPRLLESAGRKSPISEGISDIGKSVLARIESLNKQIADLKAQNEKQNTEYEQLHNAFVSAVDAFTNKRKEYNELYKEFSALNALKNKLYDDISFLQNEIQSLKAILSSADEKIAVERRAAGAIKAENHVKLEQVTAQRDDALRLVRIMRAQVDNADNAAAAARRALGALEVQEVIQEAAKVIDKKADVSANPRLAEEEKRKSSYEEVLVTATEDTPRADRHEEASDILHRKEHTGVETEFSDTETEAGETPRFDDDDDDVLSVAGTEAGSTPRLESQDSSIDNDDKVVLVMNCEDLPRADRHEEVLVMATEDKPRADRHEKVLVMATEDTPRADRHEEVLVMATEDKPRADRHEEVLVMATEDTPRADRHEEVLVMATEDTPRADRHEEVTDDSEEDLISAVGDEAEASLPSRLCFKTFDKQEYYVEQTSEKAVRVSSTARLGHGDDREGKIVARVSDMFEMARRAATNPDNPKPPVMHIGRGGTDLVNCYMALCEIYKEAGLISDIKVKPETEAKITRDEVNRYKKLLASTYYKVDGYDGIADVNSEIAKKVATQFMLVNTTGGRDSNSSAAKKAKESFFSNYNDHKRHAENTVGGLFDELHASGKENPAEYGCIDQLSGNGELYNNLKDEQAFAVSHTPEDYSRRAHEAKNARGLVSGQPASSAVRQVVSPARVKMATPAESPERARDAQDATRRRPDGGASSKA